MKARFIGWLCAAGALACTPALAAPAQGGPGAAPYPTEYVAARTAGRQMMKASEPNVTSDETHPARKVFDIDFCTVRDVEVGTASWTTDALEDLALQVSEIEASLTNGHYPDAVFRGPLTRFEQRELARIAADAPHHRGGNPVPGLSDAATDARSADLTATASAIDAARVRSGLKLWPVVTQGGCGAGESSVVLRSRPAPAAVWLITQFGFDVCKAKGLDPWDRNGCTRWGEVALGRKTYLSGNYVYQAQWMGGKMSRGQTSVQPSLDDDKPIVVWISQR